MKKTIMVVGYTIGFIHGTVRKLIKINRLNIVLNRGWRENTINNYKIDLSEWLEDRI